ncbi:MAG: tetratricopeptide repeat protein [Deltaproteobacteria bacterium]|nr:tetratricopeptide repeat protein [Deltaproteobacteria bacterium]
MKGKKELLADVLFNSKVVNLFKRLPLRNKLIILNYHRIRPSNPQFRTAFDDGVYSVNEDEFTRQIKWLKHNTLILSEKDLINQHNKSGFLPPRTSKPCVVITFDDGYRDNYTIAFQILKYFEVPAILFVTTQMINTRQLSWWDIIAYLIKHSKEPFIAFDGQKFFLPDQKQDAIMFFQQRMKQGQYELTKYLLSELSEACEVALPDSTLQDREILTWEEIRDMARHQVAIGSHTHTHRVLSSISLNSQKEEMILSKLIIEENIGSPVLTISYPVGEPRFILPETSELAAASGYLLGFTTNTGVNDWKNIQPYRVKRIARLLEKVSTVSLLTVLPELFTWDSAAMFQIKTMETNPTYADAYYRLGIIHLGQGRVDQAIRNFQEAIGFNPNYTEARIKLGISQAYAGRYIEAENNLKVILEKRPGFADIHYYLGIVHACNRQAFLAIHHLEKAIEINPGYKDAILKLGVLYCRQQQYSLALSMLERASQIDALDSDLKALVEAGQQIIKTHGRASPVLTPLFASYIGSIDQLDELIDGFVTHLGISPNLNDIMAIVEKGEFPVENLETLLNLFQEYVTTFPQYADIHYILGILFRKLDLSKDAERCFIESIRLNPNYIKARLNLFNLLKEQKRFSEAIEQGYFLERFSLPYPDMYCGMAETLLGMARYSDAKRFVQKAISINPTYPMAQQVLQQIDEHRELC